MTKHTILFLAANPLGTNRLALDQEARAIRVALERSGHRDRFELVTRWAAQPLDLLDELRKLKPTIVHFSGHGGCGAPRSDAGPGPRRDIVGEFGTVDGEHVQGLYFQGPDGRSRLVSTAALQETFGAAGASVKLVVLNACYSEVQAEALLAHVGCVIGMSGSIRDDAARNFAIGFYGGLGERESVAAAYKQGRAAISLEGLTDNERPKLKVRRGIDVDEFVVSQPATPSSVESLSRKFTARSSGARWRLIAAVLVLGALVLLARTIVLGRASPSSPAATELAIEVRPARSHGTRGATVLWVDDHPENNIHERQSLESLGLTFVLVMSNVDALERVRIHPPDMIISDMRRERDLVAGYALLESLRQSGNAVPVIIYSDSGRPERRAEARRLGAFGCTSSPNELYEYVLAALRANPP